MSFASITRLNSLGKFSYKEPSARVDNLIIGAGVVGLAIARQLVLSFPSLSTYLIERHAQPGQETSSRNSEVIHAGLYYKNDSLKTILCIRGREQLYSYCRAKQIPHRKTGKLVLAHRHQLDKLNETYRHVESLRTTASAAAAAAGEDRLVGFAADAAPSIRLLSGDEARQLEPDLSEDIAGALLSPMTGIVDSHALMQSFESDVMEGNGNIVYSTRVVRVDAHPEGFVVQLQTGGVGGSTDAIVAHTLVNASGLSANLIWNSLRPDIPIPMYFARGSYASYARKTGAKSVSRLLYPVPESEAHAFASLGTHLTLDMDGNIRFGPDLEWIQPPGQGDDDEDRWWEKYYVAGELGGEGRKVMYRAIAQYLPRIDPDGLREDYVGIRPKLVGPDGGFRDFEVRVNRAAEFAGGGKGRMISLLGIESPGLTSSMALAKFVVERISVR